ncbi:DUF362 domain-containing protein [Chloroflexota bacterium]
MAKSVVSIVKGIDAEKMVAEALSLLGGVSALIKPNSTVVVKPNVGHPFKEETSVNTSVAVVSAVIKEIRKAQPKEIILAEASARGCDTLECLEISGIGKAAEEAGIDRIIDIKREKDLLRIPIRDARADVTSVQLPRFLLEATHIVNLPIFKSHVAMVFTCALKNIKGVVQDTTHYQMHQTDLAASIMDLWSVINADLTIADLIRPAEGFGPHCTSPTDFGCIVAGKDPVAVDATVCRMVGLDIKDVKYFQAARERRFGNSAESKIDVRGNKIEEVFKPLWLPYVGGMDRWPEYDVQADGACSSCQGLLAFTMERLKALGEYEKNKGISILIGRKKKLSDKPAKDIILFGDCLKKHRGKGVYINGCPPGERYPIWSIINRLDAEKYSESYYRDKEREAEESRLVLEHIEKLKRERTAD